MEQREIKFRIIDNKKIIGYEKLTPLGWVWMYVDLNPDKGERWNPGVFTPKLGSLRTQFTGLKDKDGKEIYEGDIVKWDDSTNGERWRVAVVEIKPDIRFRIIRVNLDIIQSAKEGYVFEFAKFIYNDTQNHLYVIGNIFQNRELITNP